MESENTSDSGDIREDKEGEQEDTSSKSNCGEDGYDEDDTFKLWLKDVSKCL